MSFDIDRLGPAPDIDDFDASKLDRGDDLPDDTPPAPKDATPEPEPTDEDVPEDEDETLEDDAAKDEGPARDEKGRFAAKDAKIPKSRFDEAVGKERSAREAAERRAAELERQLAEKVDSQAKDAQREELNALETKVGELETRHAQLLIDGDIEAAAKIMREIRLTERQIAREEIRQDTVQTTSQTLEAERVELAIAQMESQFPEMNPESDAFDESLVHFALAEQKRLMASENLSPSKALIKATTAVMKRFGKPEAPTKEDKGLAAAQAQADRKQAQVAKNLDTMRRQPASTKDVGMDSDKAGTGGLPDVSKLTVEEIDALPASTLAKLRGDFL